MRVVPFAIAMSIVMVSGVVVDDAMAQSSRDAPSGNVVTCPPDVKGEPPTVGGGGSLSDKLAQSNGIICPPAGLDHDMGKAPPSGGRLKIIPAPGSGGDPNVQPK